MTGGPGDLERRVSVLEIWLETLTSEAVDVRTLAAGTDQDLADLKPKVLAHERSMNALQETLSEIRVQMHGRFAEVGSEFSAVRGEMRGEFAAVRAEMRGDFADVRAEMRAGFAHTAAGFAALAERLDRVIGEG